MQATSQMQQDLATSHKPDLGAPPTPLRSRRAASPAPTPSSQQREGPSTGNGAVGVEADGTMAQTSDARRALPAETLKFGVVASLVLVVGILLSVMLRPSNVPESQEILACAQTRQDVLDVIAGAPYEFELHDPEARIAASVATLAPEASTGIASMGEFKMMVQSMVAGSSWPVAFQQRLLAVLHEPCESKEVCTEAKQPVPFEIDAQFTSNKAEGSGWFHKAMLDIGALTGMKYMIARAQLFRSQPAEVVLYPTPADPQARDCLALRGNRTSLALHLTGHNQTAVVQQVVIEQPPRWAALRPRSLPRHFSVFGWPGDKITPNSSDSPYSVPLGTFEYSAASSAVQAFELTNKVHVKGLRLIFENPGGGENYICLYRIKAFEESGPVCSGGRVAVTTLQVK
eukprot:TRINITY_DN21372_c0_g2_i1.p1 TRINITY_DN21372_c0_g2~~TRINITY_DN21372_c0_g2_i1.p1  ORF type:complete len:401 (+),score=63.14 TRINITY_DN21372_c0_g2_i1:100-1302(+)